MVLNTVKLSRNCVLINEPTKILCSCSLLAREYDGFDIPRKTREPFKLPTLWINDLRSDTNTILGYITKWSHEDFKIENYQSHPTIKAPLSN